MDRKYCLRLSLVHMGCLEEGLLCEGRRKEAPITQRASRSPGSAPAPLSHHVSWGDSCRRLGAHWRAIPIAGLVPSLGGGGTWCCGMSGAGISLPAWFGPSPGSADAPSPCRSSFARRRLGSLGFVAGLAVAGCDTCLIAVSPHQALCELALLLHGVVSKLCFYWRSVDLWSVFCVWEKYALSCMTWTTVT